MCRREGVSLQKGMNFQLGLNHSVILMSVRHNAPYADRFEDDGSIIIYEGHDVPSSKQTPYPKEADQPVPENPIPRRVIPTWVKLEVWKRDGGKCVMCSAIDDLHFDHIIPFSRGGSSNTPDNVQLLCGRHNLQKHNKIE